MWLYIIGGIIVLLFLGGIRIVRPTHKGLVEWLGDYKKFAKPGFNWIVPVLHKMIQVNITEQMVDAKKQNIITADRLNASVDAQIYFKVKKDEASVKNSQYNVEDYKWQIVNLARTTLRNIIGNMNYEEANKDREEINSQLQTILKKEAAPWGIEIIRTELKEIDPPEDVQESMNQVIKAENDKKAAIDFASAKETEADGTKRAAIKEAEGEKRARILTAEGKAEAIKLENEAARKYFRDAAQLLKKLEVTEASLKDNTKVVLTEKGITPQIILGEIPTRTKGR